ncbi:MAG TPA: electron transfer flavoprotein subunit alpha, partial [Candidatus Rifleibacterium sp.]|nr:electron transfer flavoprotein subunit alpha [Candidatus Rifleibacterium sp.]
MSNININLPVGQNLDELVALCPFNAIEKTADGLAIGSGCRMCRVCIKRRPEVFSSDAGTAVKKINKGEWRGIAVYADHLHGVIHPVSFELIGKAREMAARTSQPVYCL